MQKLAMVAVLGVLMVAGSVAQDVTEPEISGNNGILGWDAPALNEDGSVCDDLSGRYELGVWLPGADVQSQAPLRLLEVDCLSDCQSRIKDLVSGLDEGLYAFAARAYDRAGNVSRWSESLVCDVDKIVPAPPKNIQKIR